MQKIRIDFDNPGLPQHISAVENDSQSRFFQATLYENGKAYTAPAGATYSIMYHGFGPQNQGWYDTINDGAGKWAACTASGNVVTCEIARQALQVPGHVSIVLCVTAGNGYMLKSWPIECDCKNDRYDSTAEIESFFYITQVSNADWTQAIQALKDLKNTIDPTLSVEGKAADAKATGDAVGELKKDIEAGEQICVIDTFSFLQGSIQTGAEVSGNTRIRTKEYSADFIRAYCMISAGYKANIVWYTDDTSKSGYISSSGFQSGKFDMIPPNNATYFKLIVANEDDSQINADNVNSNVVTIFMVDKNIPQKPHSFRRNVSYEMSRLSSANYWYLKDDDGENENYIENRVEKINSYYGPSIIFITDTHWRTPSKANHSWDLTSIFASRAGCKNVFYGGDALTQYATSKEALYQLQNEMYPFITRLGTDFKYIFGNHDANLANVGSGAFTDDPTVYAIKYEDIYKSCASHLADEVFYEKSTTTDKEYLYREKLHYYFDDAEEKIRYIVLDTGTQYDQLNQGGNVVRLRYQYNWLCKVLDETPSGYIIMLFGHKFTSINNKNVTLTPQAKNVTVILNAYMNAGTFNIVDDDVTCTYDFANGKRCTIVGMVSGDIHMDYIGKINGINQIVTTCDAADHTTWGDAYDRTIGTKGEHAFDIIKIDKSKRVVRLFRIGAGNDRKIVY